jgi:Kef-type K+ transport system membrane component KefB
MSSDQDRRDPVARLFGALLMGVGVLMMTLCGMCSLVFVISTAGGGGGEMGGMLLLVLVIGGVPIAVGFGIFWLGRWLRRPKDL